MARPDVTAANKTAVMIRVGFIIESDTWLGGLNYFRNLLLAVEAVREPRISPVIFTAMHNTRAADGLSKVEVCRTPVMDRLSPSWLARKALGVALRSDPVMNHVLAAQRIEVLSHRAPLTSASRIKTIGWIPDFQHLRLPEFFTKSERLSRDRAYMHTCESCDSLIVSSHCALDDLRSFAPQHAHKANVLHFVATPGDAGKSSTLQALMQRYDFDGAFFLLPNQFWMHKNHRVVIDALNILKRRGRRAVVLATGHTTDHRNPDFFRVLMKHARDCDVLDVFKVLGVVPYDDLSGLMRHAVAFINPSRFEGWSTSVEEAKSLRKPVILSDIAVHREQAPEFGRYFPPDDGEALAQCISELLLEIPPAAETAINATTCKTLAARRLEFGLAFENIVVRTSDASQQTA